MNSTAIQVNNLTKQFKIYKDFFLDRLREKIFFWKSRTYYRLFTALDNVSFSIGKGEVVGLIGPNGAGKSTMLKILAEIMYPTSGEIKLNGTLVAVLSLGLGFNPRFTGRENIRFGGSLLGMSLKEIREKENWVIEFSELKNFIDQPIRSYSSGMHARLSFAVAAAVSPDILIIDEALATGDAFFVQKSLGRINEICKTGTTAVFVSHNLMQIQRLCSERVLLMEKGKLIMDDKAPVIIKHYNDLLYKYREEADRFSANAHMYPEKEWFGNGKTCIIDAFFTDAQGVRNSVLKTGSCVYLRLRYFAREKTDNVWLNIVAENYSGICAIGFNSTYFLDADSGKIIKLLLSIPQGEGEIILKYNPLLLTTNRYLLSVYLYDYENSYNNKDSTFIQDTIFSKQHFLEFSVIKPYDLNTTNVLEHPVTLEVRPDIR